MYSYTSTLVLFSLSCQLFSCYGEDYYNIYNWKFHFPEGSSMGILFALAMPIDIPNKNVFFSYNLEAVYSLPGNETREDYPPLVVRDESGRILHGNIEAGYNQTLKTIDRKLIYNLLETKLTMHGYPGHSCLLRLICETALMSVSETNGVLGDLFHIIFTPSSSTNENLNDEYTEAENNGKISGSCETYYNDCNTGILDLISRIEHVIEEQ